MIERSKEGARKKLLPRVVEEVRRHALHGEKARVLAKVRVHVGDKLDPADDEAAAIGDFHAIARRILQDENLLGRRQRRLAAVARAGGRGRCRRRQNLPELPEVPASRSVSL
jgi:hypothetical protein